MSGHGRFAWFELVTPDVEGGAAFWSEVGGLSRQGMDMGGTEYVMLARGEPFAGVVTPQMPEVRPHWLSYWGVDDVDARAARVPAAGGTVVVPPTDIPNVGRFAIVADPQGAVFALFRGASDDAPSPAIGWVELWARDAPAVLPFYVEVLGLTTDVRSMRNGGYHVLYADGQQVAGVMNSPNPTVPPMWLPYLTVDDVDSAGARATQHGGTLASEWMTVPGVGRFGVVLDRQRAALALLQRE
ncbi:MAG: VOC family protein [Myxococcota bacterium]